MSSEPPAKKKRRGGPRRRTGWYAISLVLWLQTNLSMATPASVDTLAAMNRSPSVEISEDSTWKIIRSDASSQNQTTDQPDQDLPTLIDIFRSHINDLSELPAAGDVLLGTNNISPESFSTPATATSSNAINKISLTSESVFLLQTYVRTVATWMDCFDHSCTYQLKIPPLVLKSPLLFHAVCAFTANHVALSNLSQGKSWKIIAARHYGEALTLLIDALSLPSHEHALTASMLLLSYEIHEAQQSDDYKSHFEGMAMLVQSRGVNAQSTGTDLANFWIYIRHDIVSAMAGERPLILDPADWAVSWIENEKREDVLGNQVLWILARVVNLVFSEDGRSDAGKAKRRDFLEELETWRSGLSETFVGIPYGDEDEDGFRKVYFPVIAAAAAAFWFGVTHILLMAEPTLQSESYVPLIQDQARRVINIAISDFPPALKVFSTHGLFYAAKHVQGISRKARVWNILNDVETQTGYSTRTTVRLLQALVERDTSI